MYSTTAVLGADPRDLIRRADKRLFDLGERIGPIPGTNRSFFPTNPTTTPGYEDALDVILPRPGTAPSFAARVAHGIINFGARALPA